MIKYLLDTNILIYVLNDRSKSCAHQFTAHEGRLAMSVITFAELCYGAEYSSKSTSKIKLLNLVATLPALPYTPEAAQHYGDIKATLRRQGQLISDNDMHIAGHARSHGLILVTNNVKEFQRVDGLRIENWS